MGAWTSPAYLFLGGLAGASSALAAGAQLSGHPDWPARPRPARPARSALSLAAAGPRSRPPGPVRQHAARAQGDLADERRHLARCPPTPRRRWPLAGSHGRLPHAGRRGHGRGRGVRPRGRRLHLGADRRHRHARLARRLPRAALSSSPARPPPRPAGSACSRSRRTGRRPAARLAVAGAAAELTAELLLDRRLGPEAEPYRAGRSGALMRAGQVLAVAGAATALLGRRSRAVSALAGAALLAGSAAHQVRRLRRRPGVGAGPEVHGRPAAPSGGELTRRAAGRPA